MIVIENVSKKYGEKQVLENFSFIFPDKGFIVINGKSGIGKTTLLNIIMGLETADSGAVKFVDAETSNSKPVNTSDSGTLKYANVDQANGKPAHAHSKNCSKISVVFQDDRLLENDTVIENVTLVMDEKQGLKEKGHRLIESENLEKAKGILSELGLEKEIDEKVSKLSGGMKRRVAIARSLSVDADVYIMDEPIKGLDKSMAGQTLEMIHKYTDGKGKLLIMVTHNPEEFSGCTDCTLVNDVRPKSQK